MSIKQLSVVEKHIQTITYKNIGFEIVERPDVFWVGCVNYAQNNSDESDIGSTLKRYREELIDVPKLNLIIPDWSASISINYTNENKPCGIMFAQETYSDKQDGRYDLLAQPGGLWLRLRNDEKTAETLLNKEKAEPWEFFAGEQAPLQSAAKENGYKQNPDIHIQIEYHCHAEYNTPPHTNFACIPIYRI